MDEDWQQEEIRLARSQASQQPLGAQRLMNEERALELANKAYSLYEMQTNGGQRKLLEMVFSNCQLTA
jgi:hypothetical protein